MTETWTREQVKSVLEQLKQLPDFDCLPLPENIYKEYNIPMPPRKIVSFNDYMAKHNKTRDIKVDSFETRESDGILRTVKEEEPTKLIICSQEETDKVLESLKEKNDDETEKPQNQS